MNRTFQWLNLAGVVALAVLCAFQWQRDRRLNLELNGLEKTRLAQEQKLAEQERNARGLTDDLTRFKEQFTQTRAELAEAGTKLRTAEQGHAQLTAERDQLRESVANWSKAVTERDARTKEANERISELAGKLNDSILKFNQLATNYEAVRKELSETRRTNTTASRQP